MTPPVPTAYLGVWRRTRLETPGQLDTSSSVHWLQTSHWHGDLRLPASGDRTRAQGFGGITTVTRPDPAQAEVCTWHRRIDLEPPRPTPDEGHMVFETSERVIETGIHGTYLEVWERLPESLGATLALGRGPDEAPELFLVAGQCAMHLRPAPHRAHFLIAFGTLSGGQWRIAQATDATLDGQALACRLSLEGNTAVLQGHALLAGPWRVLDS